MGVGNYPKLFCLSENVLLSYRYFEPEEVGHSSPFVNNYELLMKFFYTHGVL